MPKNIAVVSDAISDKFIFDKFYSYYSSQFGANAIYIVTYKGLKSNFSSRELGGVIELPCHYEDPIRAKFISGFVTSLLSAYQGVVRVDQDEFLVPKSGGNVSLRDFLESYQYPYISARGFDLIAGDSEGPLNLNENILISQRRFAYANSPLNKVCYTTVPTVWAEGFHSCTLFPHLDSLYLFHLKFADLDLQLSWRSEMTSALGDKGGNVEQLRIYYKPDYDRLVAYRNGIITRPLVKGYEGLNRIEHQQKFLASTELLPSSGVYRPAQFHDTVLVELPDDLSGAF